MRPSYIEPLEARIAPATLAITPLIVDEGDEGTVDKVKHIQVTLDQPVAQDVTVHYTLVDGTAHLNNQYSPGPGQASDGTGTLTFAAGSTTAQTIDVVINGNSVVNPDTSFSIHLDNITGGVNPPAADGTVTIWDDDSIVNFSQASQNQAVNEGSAATPGHFDYTATLSAPADHPIQVTFMTTAHGSSYGDATATGAAADYTPVTTTLTFAPGTVTSPTATVNINGDSLPGPDEVFNASLSKAFPNAPFGAKLGDQISTTSTILNDDGSDQSDLTVSLVSDTVSTSEGGIASFGLQLSRLSESPVVVTYHTSDGATHTATAGSDYVSATNATKTIDGALQDAIQVQVLTDTHVEGAETFNLTLDSASVNGAPIALGATKTATATIAADPLPSLVFVPVGSNHGDITVFDSTSTTPRTADFQVKLAYLDVNGNVDTNHHFDLTTPVTVDYATVSGTATGSDVTTAGDYVNTHGTLTFDANTTDTTPATTIHVPINVDGTAEASETFSLHLSNANGALIGDDTAVATILSSDHSTFALNVSSPSVSEGNQGTTTAVFTVVPGTTIPNGYQLVVDYATKDGTATGTAGTTQDYQPATGHLTFDPGTSFKTVSVAINGDTVIEGDENFTLQLSNGHLVPVGSSAGTAGAPVDFTGTGVDSNGHAIGTATIVNDDGHAISASITANAATQPEGAGSTANFNVHLSQMYSSPITVHYTVNQTSPADPTVATNSTLSFDIPAYTQDATLPITYVNDSTVNHDQSLTVTLNSLESNDKTASLVPLVSAKTAKTTILEDDFYVQVLDASQQEGKSGTTALLSFPVQLVDVSGHSVTLDHAVSVPFHTIEGTGATGAVSTGTGADFLARTGTVVIPAHQKQQTADITIRGDANVGGDETFGIQLGAPTIGQLYNHAANAAITGDHSKAIGTIISDDTATPPTVTVVALSPGVEADPAHGIAGSPATFQVKLSAPSEQPVTFDYATNVLTASQNGDLAAQSDFTATSGSSTIASGETSTIISVPIVADTENENAEQFGLTLSNFGGSSNASGSTLTVEGTIAASNQPTISVAKASHFEGDSGQANSVTFTVKLSAPTTKDVTFYVETLATGGTATSGDDYVPLAKQMVTITAGQSQVTQDVVINGDTAGEPNETFLFHVSGVVNATPVSLDAVGTILNDDTSFTIQPTKTVNEQDGTATLTVSRSGDVTGAADVSFQTIDGTGATGAVSTGAFPDFAGGPGTVHFAAGQTTQLVKVGVVNDNRHEMNETFSVQLTGSNNGIIGTANTSVVTIQDNDAIPTATLSTPAAVLEKDSGLTDVTFTVTLDHANDVSDILLTYSTANGTATAGQDYNSVTDQHLTIEKGLLSKTFTVQVINDTTYDSLKTETFQVNVSPDSAVTGDPTVKFANNATHLTGTVSIIDNEVAPQVSIANASFAEGSNSNFTVTLNHPSDKPVTVQYYTVDGTAVAGADYAGKSSTAPGTITFAPGVTSMSVTNLAAKTDTLVEGNETFKVQLAAPTGATLSKTAAVATGTIIDTNHAYVSINDVSLLEGNSGTKDAIFTVSLAGDTAVPVTYNYFTGDITATAGQDYVAKSGTVTLGGPNGPHSAQIAVKVNGDLAKEGDETFRVYLSGSTVATLTTPYGNGTILNDGDTQPTISVSSAVGQEGDPTSAGGTGDTLMHFTVTASDVLAAPVTFTVKTAEILKAANVARLGTDFLQPKSATDPNQDLTITIPASDAGATTPPSVGFDVTIKADSVFEPTEFFNVILTNITGAQPGNVVGTGTIYDNDLYFSKQAVKWTDVDGDLVTLSVNKGNLGTVGFGFDTTSANVGTMGGRILQQLNLVSPQAGTSFAHANLSIMATQQPNAAGQLVGDGRVNVGYIRANTSDSAPTLIELKGVDLANVTIDGDLSRINVGDLYNDYAIGTLSTYSIGVHSATTEVGGTDSTTGAAVPFHGNAQSQILAGAGTIKVANDISGDLFVTGGTTGRIGNLIVGGALRGTDDADSARIFTTGAITKATFHDIIGGAGARSASLTQYDTTASLGSLTVTGNITAGAGVESAHILFPTIGSVTIGGSLSGGPTGGGFISASNSLGSVTIDGNFQGGAHIYGGGLKDNQAIKSVIVHGNVNNAEIKGGYVANLVNAFTTPAALEFAANADAQIGTVQIDGSVSNLNILAGTDPSGTAKFNQDSAALFSRIAQVIFNGDILPDTTAHYISAQSIGTIIVQGASKTGSVAGTELAPGSNFFEKYAV